MADIDTEKSEENNKPKLKLDTLGTGVNRINTGFSLPEVIAFIKDFNVKVSVETGNSEKEMEIAVPVPTTVNPHIKDLDGFNSNIYITKGLENPTYKKLETRKILHPVDFIAVMLLDKKVLEVMRDVKAIDLETTLPRNEMENMIITTIGNIPENWQINFRPGLPASKNQS